MADGQQEVNFIVTCPTCLYVHSIDIMNEVPFRLVAKRMTSTTGADWREE